MKAIILLAWCLSGGRALAGDVLHSDAVSAVANANQRAVNEEKRTDIASCLSKLQHIRGMISRDGGFTPLSDSQEKEVLRTPAEIETYETEKKEYLNCLMTEIKSWSAEKILPYYQALNRNISEIEGASYSKELTHRLAFLLEARSRVEDELFTPVLAELRRDYRKELTPLREQAKRKPLSPEEYRRYSDLTFQEYLLLQVSPEELDALRKKRTAYPALDKRGKDYLNAHPALFEQLASAEIQRNNLSLSVKDFKKYFEPRVAFDEEGNAKLSFVPSMTLQKKQAQQAIAITTSERGNRDEKTSLVRFEPLGLPNSTEASLGLLKASHKLRLFDRTDRQLVDRSSLRSGGLEATGDETTLVTFLASGGASVMGQSVRGATNFSKEQLVKMAKAGLLFGGSLDIVDQAALNFDDWRKGKRLSGYSPLQTLLSAGSGMVLAPFVVASPRLQQRLLLGGAASTGSHLAEGNLGQATVAGVGTILTPKVIERTLKGLDLSPKGAALSDLHFHVVADPITGRVVIDKEHASWKAFVATMERVGKNPDDYAQVLINGDFIDAESLKNLRKSGVPVDMVNDRQRLIAEVVQYASDSTGGKEVLPGLGNHDATLKAEKYNPVTGETKVTYRGEEVATKLKEQGILVYAVDDTDVARIKLPTPEGAPPVYVVVSHKPINDGPNLQALNDPMTLKRIEGDVKFTGNPQAEGNEIGTLSSDTHKVVLIEGLHNPNRSWWGRFNDLLKYGQFYRQHSYLNSGALNPLVNATMVESGIPRRMGTFGEYQTDRRGRLHWKIFGVAEGSSGRYETFEIDPKSYSALVPAPYGDGIARPIYRNNMPQGLNPDHLSLLYQASRMSPLFLSVPYPASEEEVSSKE